MTTTKTKNSKPATTRKSMRELIPGRGSTPASSRRRTASGSNGLLGRVQATRPGTQRNAKKSAAQKIGNSWLRSRRQLTFSFTARYGE